MTGLILCFMALLIIDATKPISPLLLSVTDGPHLDLNWLEVFFLDFN